ncbi:MAG: GTPase/DUF3482 domain-containing protein [Oceanicoccus sp.]
MKSEVNLPLNIAVVGHTNVGKTSLIRTLTRRSSFGDVSSSPGTTRHVESQVLMVNGQKIVRLLDTPGFEDSIGLFDAIEELDDGREKLGTDRLTLFLNSKEATTSFSQEAKVVRQLLECDVVFYVIDAREPVLGKYQDELRIISLAAKPVFPLLNFVVAENSRVDQWTTLLKELNLHTSIQFDSVAYDFFAEQQLYKKMQTMLTNNWHQPLESLINHRLESWQALLIAAANCVATLLIESAAFRQTITGDNALSSSADQLQQAIRKREHKATLELLALFQFQPDDYGADLLPVSENSWKLDLFDPETLKLFGVKATSTAAKGAAIGLGVDMAVGGVSLGAAAALGALFGGIWQTGKQFGREAIAYISGERYLCVEDNTLRLIWRRNTALTLALRHRGHAAQTQIVVDKFQSKETAAEKQVMKYISVARNHPEWSNRQGFIGSTPAAKQNSIAALAAIITDQWQ